MNEPYSSWAARNSPDDRPLAARYQSAEPIVLRGSKVYPMYTEQVGPDPTAVTVTLLSAAPPAGLRGLGMGLSVVDGYVGLNGRRLNGVDVWSDALVGGITFDIIGTAPSTLVTLTPVWVDGFGEQKSWVGNYGIVVENTPDGRVVLWCSIGEGPANFANLVVEVQTAPAVPHPAVDAQPTHPMRPPNLPSASTGVHPSAAQDVLPTQPNPGGVNHPPTTQPAQHNPSGSFPTNTHPPTTQPAEHNPSGSFPTNTHPPAAQPAEHNPSGGFPPNTQPPATQPTQQNPSGGFPANAHPPATQPAQHNPSGGFPANAHPPATQPADHNPNGGFPPNTYPPAAQPADHNPNGGFPPNTHPPATQPAQHNPGNGLAANTPSAPSPAYSGVAQPPNPHADTQSAPTPPLGSDAQYGPGVQSAPTRPMRSGPPADETPAPDEGASYRTALYDLGVAMYSRGEEDQACGLWTQAADAGHAGAAYDLGVVHFRRGDLADAHRWWREAAERREPRAMAGLAELLDRQGDYAEARAWRARADEERLSNADQSVG
ncbi:tetratricopeptide repeat protein [Nocardia sp. NPDC052316]|uniref:tetratricopeptide repeat protein n=1 Tax=Nocardia sp. NPDC052316 TaxID=3364329 RepID=UPI0037C789BF